MSPDFEHFSQISIWQNIKNTTETCVATWGHKLAGVLLIIQRCHLQGVPLAADGKALTLCHWL
jgi:hypothetical protein